MFRPDDLGPIVEIDEISGQNIDGADGEPRADLR